MRINTAKGKYCSTCKDIFANTENRREYRIEECWRTGRRRRLESRRTEAKKNKKVNRSLYGGVGQK